MPPAKARACGTLLHTAALCGLYALFFIAVTSRSSHYRYEDTLDLITELAEMIGWVRKAERRSTQGRLLGGEPTSATGAAPSR